MQETVRGTSKMASLEDMSVIGVTDYWGQELSLESRVRVISGQAIQAGEEQLGITGQALL